MADHPELDQAIQEILATARSHRVAIGTDLEARRLSERFGVPPAFAERRLIQRAKDADMDLHVLPPAKIGR